MNTGNLQNARPLAICVKKITDADGFLATNPQGETYLASFLGWDRGAKIVADGTTEEAAIQRLARLTETSADLIGGCEIHREYP